MFILHMAYPLEMQQYLFYKCKYLPLLFLKKVHCTETVDFWKEDILQ